MSPKVTESHKEERKRSILEAAKKIFIRKGYEAFVMQDVIDAVDLSRGGVYYYFSSKEDLFLSILEDSNNTYSKEIKDMAKHPSIWNSLVKDFEDYKSASDTEDLFGAVQIEYFLINRLLPEKKIYMKERYEFAIEHLIKLFDEGVKKGEFSPKYPLDTIARYFITFNDGINIATIFLNKKDLNFNAQIDIFLSHLESMLGVIKQ
jgi:TetR/AcrR family transcriptional regulator, transcriptional repressor of aconitase